MAIFKNQFPTRQDLFTVFLACVFPIHIWALFNVMREVPAWILRMSTWEMAGVIAYTQFYALIEAVIVFLGMVLLITILPIGGLRKRFVSVATAVILISSIWFIILHLNGQMLDQRQVVLVAAWAGTYLLALVGALFALFRSEKVANFFAQFAQRVVVLSVIYLFIDLLSLVLIVVRNV